MGNEQFTLKEAIWIHNLAADAGMNILPMNLLAGYDASSMCPIMLVKS